MSAIQHRDFLQYPNNTALSDPGPLSPRQAECVLCIAEGLKAKTIATVMGITQRTAEAHAEAAMEKLGASNRAHLIAIAFSCKILVAGAATFKCLLVNLIVGLALAISVTSTNANLMRPRPARPVARVVRTTRARD